MKENKITRKIKRLELLQDLIESMQRTMEDLERRKENSEQELADHVKNEAENWQIEYTQKDIEEFTIRLDEAKKLFTELEKMA